MGNSLESKVGSILNDIKNTILSDLTPDFLKNLRGESILNSNDVDDKSKRHLPEMSQKGLTTIADRHKILSFDKGMKIMDQVKCSASAKVLGADFFSGIMAAKLGLPASKYEQHLSLTMQGDRMPNGGLRRAAYDYGRKVMSDMKAYGRGFDFKQCMQLFLISNYAKVKDYEQVKAQVPLKIKPDFTNAKKPEVKNSQGSTFRPMMTSPKRETQPDGSVIVTDILGRQTRYANQWLANTMTDYFSGFPISIDQLNSNADARLERSKLPDLNTQRLQQNLEKSRAAQRDRDMYVQKYKEAQRTGNKRDMETYSQKAHDAEWRSLQAIGKQPYYTLTPKIKGIDY